MNEITNNKTDIHNINLNVSNVNSDSIRLIPIIYKDIKSKLDISNSYLNNIFNSEIVNEKIKFIQSCHYINLIINIINYNKSKLINNKSYIRHNIVSEMNNLYSPYSNISNYTEYKYDKHNLCGHILEKLNNGIIIFCNEEEFMHNHADIDIDVDIDYINHKFTPKKDDNIKLEEKQNKIIGYYQNYINILYTDMKNIIYYYIYKDLKYEYVNIYDIERINYYKSNINKNNKLIFMERNLYIDDNKSYIKIYSD